jgi:hypothetical protein
MNNRRLFLQGLAAMSTGVLIADGKMMALDVSASQPQLNWPDFVKSIKGHYPCALVMEFSDAYHSQFLALQQTQNRPQLLSLHTVGNNQYGSPSFLLKSWCGHSEVLCQPAIPSHPSLFVPSR